MRSSTKRTGPRRATLRGCYGFVCRHVVRILVMIGVVSTSMVLFYGARVFASSPFVWDLITTSDYTYDSSKISIADGLASLVGIDQTDSDNSSTGFGGGTNSGTTFDGSVLRKSVADTSSASFTSRVIDAGTTTTWSSITWTPTKPYLKNLPGSRAVETAYSSGNADMSSNQVLLHLDEATGTQSFIDASGFYVTSTCSSQTCPTAGAAGALSRGLSFNGAQVATLGDVAATEGVSALTVEGWVKGNYASTSNHVQPMIEKWSSTTTMASSDVTFYDMAAGVSASSTNFASTVFDGRYVYFAPVVSGGPPMLTRYDTHGSMSDPSSYQNFNTTPLIGRSGYTAVNFDGRYVYYIPFSLNGNLLRYDTQGSFTDSGSYAVFDTTTLTNAPRAFMVSLFDGRYLYMIGQTKNGVSNNCMFVRYDTQASFSSASSYQVFDVLASFSNVNIVRGMTYDGRYVYFTPFTGPGGREGSLVRYDTQASFTDSASYSVFDTTTVDSNSKGFWGLIFDGRYVYMIPQHNGAYFGQITRYDTQADFSTAGSYSVFDTAALDTHSKAFSGGVFDGRYIYLIPGQDAVPSNDQITRYDTLGSFTATSSYSFLDLKSLNASLSLGGGSGFDGRYIYYTQQTNGILTRLDTVGAGSRASFGLRAAQSSDGMSSTVPGIQGRLETTSGHYTVGDFATQSASVWHHYAMTYDGTTLKLYADGALTDSTPAMGAIVNSDATLDLGMFNHASSTGLVGSMDEVAIYTRALSATEIQDHYYRGALRMRFQVRSCSASNCADGTFIGPDGTAGTYYSELSNSTTSTPSISLTNVNDGRYFQYRGYLETDTSSAGPTVSNVTFGPLHYVSDRPSIVGLTGPDFTRLTDLTPTYGGSNQGTATFQLSADGSVFWYWTGTQWSAATSASQSNTASQINAGLPYFVGQVGKGAAKFRAYLTSTSGTQAVVLDDLSLGYEFASSGGSRSVGGGSITPLDLASTQPPAGPFDIVLDGYASTTKTLLVDVHLSAGTEVPSGVPIDRMVLSNREDFEGAVIVPYTSDVKWLLCDEAVEDCPSGLHTVYAKFYTVYGQVSPRIQASIYFVSSGVSRPRPVTPPSTTPTQPTVPLPTPVIPVIPPPAPVIIDPFIYHVPGYSGIDLLPLPVLGVPIIIPSAPLIDPQTYHVPGFSGINLLPLAPVK